MTYLLAARGADTVCLRVGQVNCQHKRSATQCPQIGSLSQLSASTEQDLRNMCGSYHVHSARRLPGDWNQHLDTLSPLHRPHLSICGCVVYEGCT